MKKGKQQLVSSGFTLLYNKRPASYQGSTKSKSAYENDMASCYRRKYKGKLAGDDLYGNVFYFFKEDVKLDADNISKPTWDGLVGVAFIDDKQITIRSAASIDLSKHDMMVVDMDNIPTDIVYDWMNSLFENDHTVYIEVGTIATYNNLFNINNLWK